MIRAGRFNGELMDYIRPFIKPGVTTEEINRLVHERTTRNGYIPAPLGYLGFPKSCCTSVNDVICHGIPGDYTLKDGDIVNVDLTSIVDGWHGDSSETFLIGEVSDEARAVTQCAFDCLYAAIAAITPGCRVSDIGDTVVKLAGGCGFSVVQEFVGHGLGQKFHQDPHIPHYPNRQARNDRLHPGMCFTIEPMINVGGRDGVTNKKDGWTVTTKDGSLSAQFEHSIMMTEDGPRILTPNQDGPKPGNKL